MLPSRKRLAAAEVREILKNGSTLRAGALLAKYMPGAGAAAVVVSKKVSGTAVVRNRIRRALYQALGASLPRARVVLLVQKKMDDYSTDIENLCSKLSS